VGGLADGAGVGDRPKYREKRTAGGAVADNRRRQSGKSALSPDCGSSTFQLNCRPTDDYFEPIICTNSATHT